MASKRRHVLPSNAWVDGANIQIPLRSIPKGSRVRAFVLRLEAVITAGGAPAIVVGNTMHRLIQMIDVNNGQIRGSGQMWHFLEWMMHGGEVYLPANVPAAAGAYRRTMTWVIPFRDGRAFAPSDAEYAGADFANAIISVDTAAYAGLDAATWGTVASVTGTLRAEAVLDEPNDAVAAPLVYGFADLTGQSPDLPALLYRDLFLYRETAATVSSVEVATCAIQADGVQIHDAVKLGEYARAFNDAWGKGADLQTTHATAPLGGERLPDIPGYALADPDTVTMPFVPLIFPDPAYKLTQLVRAENNLRLDFTGTDTTFRVGYAGYRRRSEAEAVAAFRRLGRGDVTGAAQVAPKTASKKGLTGVKKGYAGFFPLRAVKSR